MRDITKYQQSIVNNEDRGQKANSCIHPKIWKISKQLYSQSFRRTKFYQSAIKLWQTHNAKNIVNYVITGVMLPGANLALIFYYCVISTAISST